MKKMLNGKEINEGIIRTNSKCAGCNKCLSTCPVFDANIASNEDGTNKIFVNQDTCILCGRCIDVCTHGARDFQDDTQKLFYDLRAITDGRRKRGISLLVAPAFMINYPKRYKMILGYLKHMGINHIYSVSFGADITIWGYINYLAQTGAEGMIAQPCPAIVKYIEVHRPALIKKLMPIQSPAMCEAIYLKKYLGITDDLAFLGPCIAKKSEFEAPQNEGYIKYSITFKQLMKEIDKTDISLFEAEDSELEYGMGAMFSKHGGMRENLEYYLGLDSDAYINQKEGENYSYSFLDLYSNRVDMEDPYRAELVDILNCTRGCNYGTATEFKNSPLNHIPYAMNLMRVEKSTGNFPDTSEIYKTPKERLAALNKRFGDLKLEDFYASYSDLSINDTEVSAQTIMSTFKDMLKITEAEQNMDCSSCGMKSCKDMAKAIALGNNYKENCNHFLKKKLFIEQNESSIQKQKYELLQASKNVNVLPNIDQLTGFMNRYGFEQQMEKSLQSAHATGTLGYVIMLDLDDFKNVNDSYGQDFGNSLLMRFSMFLKEQFSERAYIFRAGGDEFAMIFENSTTAEARLVTDILIKRVQTAWEIFGVRLYCTVSIGVVGFPDSDESVNDVVLNAELAMYTAKQNGKNNCIFYTPDLQRDVQGSVEMIRSMRDSIARDYEGFDLAFQPWVTPDGKIIGCEALMRWKDDDKNISPGVFIPIAEETGLIIPLGEFVLQRAAEACRKINEFLPDFRMSINVSTKQIEKSDIYSSFINILNKEKVDFKNIVLEVTESIHLENSKANSSLIKRFAESGLNIALDDFGTGYSSLSYLHKFSFDLIKIDRAFIKDIEEDTYYGHLLEMIVEFMHKVGRLVCVEGVEEKEQLEFCSKTKVDIIQGFYFYKPMPFQDLIDLLKRQKN